jgi:4-diphosphocytidyl-2C-methyl-D-erythritol kinase
VSTREAFGWFDASAAGVGAAALELADEMVNDLEDPLSRGTPKWAVSFRPLRRAGAVQAAMSGSGSAVFGLFSRRPAAVRAAGTRRPPAGTGDQDASTIRGTKHLLPRKPIG